MSCSHCGGCGKHSAPAPLSDMEKSLLDLLAQNPFLPLCRLLLRSHDNEELSFVMSAPVYLPYPDTTTEEVRSYGAALLSLQRRGYLTIDYDIPISGFDYDSWKDYDYYRSFVFSVEAPGVEPVMENGSTALTLSGQEALD